MVAELELDQVAAPGVAPRERQEVPDPGLAVRPEEAVQPEDERGTGGAQAADRRELFRRDLGCGRRYRPAGELARLDPRGDAEAETRSRLRHRRDGAGAEAGPHGRAGSERRPSERDGQRDRASASTAHPAADATPAGAELQQRSGP